MKNFLLLVVLTLVGLESFSQARTDNPILPRKYEEGYTIEQIKNFALGKMDGVSLEYASNYRKKLLSVINEGLRRSGEYVNLNNGKPLGDDYVEWIYEHVYRVDNDSLPANHANTWKNGNQVSPTVSKKPYYGPLDHFKYGVCEIKLGKPSCANLTPDYSLLGYVKHVEPEKSNQRSEPEKTKKQENTLIDYGTEENIKKLQARAKFVADSIATAIANAKKNATPVSKTKFFKRKGVKVAGFVLMAVGVEELIRNFLVPLIFPKKVIAGEPGGSPTTKEVVIPPTVIPPGGSPGGAPTTK